MSGPPTLMFVQLIPDPQRFLWASVPARAARAPGNGGDGGRKTLHSGSLSSGGWKAAPPAATH
jgi:hypothetical protein